MRRVEIGVLGPFQIVGKDGTPLSAIPSRPRRLLASLVAYGGSASTATLLTLLFGDQSMVDKTHELEKTVSATRNVLEMAGVSRAALNKIAGGYSVDRACIDWDSARFEGLAADGRRLLDQGDTRGALQPLRTGLACWRGQVASELDPTTGEPARLDEMRVTVWENLIEAELANGHHGEMIGELRKLIQAHPTRERLAFQLLLALYRAGRPADALSEYQRIYREITGWGLDPGEALADLARRIALSDPTLTYTPNLRPSADRRRNARGPLSVRPLIEWLAEAAAVSPSAIEREVRAHMDRLAEPGPDALEERRYRRRRVPREAVTRTLIEYYGEDELERFGLGPFRFHVHDHVRTLGVVSRPEWTRANVPLGEPGERCLLIPSSAGSMVTPLSPHLLQPSIVCLAEAEHCHQNVWDDDIYRLAQIHLSADTLRASFALDRFVHYALTLSLLEHELLDALAAHDNDPSFVLSHAETALPLRKAYLPDAESLAQVSTRLCAGGIATLFVHAVDEGEYRAILHRRSQKVFKRTGRLSVVPQAWHQPVWDPQAEVCLSTTVERELEEELLGRKEVTRGEDLQVLDPYHLASRTPQMRWLLENRAAWHRECTGLSINLLTGTYDFSCLIVISDPTFGQLWPNWETERTIPLSLRPSNIQRVREKALDASWVDEALFAFFRGLRRFGELYSSPALADL
jgi:DNA-binding SARP family transcriptional activator